MPLAASSSSFLLGPPGRLGNNTTGRRDNKPWCRLKGGVGRGASVRAASSTPDKLVITTPDDWYATKRRGIS